MKQTTKNRIEAWKYNYNEFIHMCKTLWLAFSVCFLKRKLNLETRAYKAWWEQRCIVNQRMIDKKLSKTFDF